MPFKFFYPWDDDEELCRARPGSPPAFFALPSPVSPRRCGNCMPGMAAATSAHPSKVLVPPLPQQQPSTVPVSDPSTSCPPSVLFTNFATVGDSYSYTYLQLLEATSGFCNSNLIKHGHSGDFFKGVLEGGYPVVIKKINLQPFKKKSYPTELDFFSKVTDRRFVPFLGHCLENENEKFLVYKYMPNEDLACSLSKKGSSDDDSLQSLDWIKRLKIAVGAAEGLTYLHHEWMFKQAAYFSMTNSRFFLAALARSSDQGSSDSTNENFAYDVYCFGKVLLQLVTGKLGLSASTDAETKEWLEQTLPYISIYDMELVTKIVDPLLIVDEDHLEQVWAMAIVAQSCLNPKPARRPPMRYVLKALENSLKIVREDDIGSGSHRSRGTWLSRELAAQLI